MVVVKADELKKTMTNQQPSIESKLNQALAEKEAINRQKLGSIMKIIVLCGRHNISIRGHRDNLSDLEKDFSSSVISIIFVVVWLVNLSFQSLAIL